MRHALASTFSVLGFWGRGLVSASMRHAVYCRMYHVMHMYISIGV